MVIVSRAGADSNPNIGVRINGNTGSDYYSFGTRASNGGDADNELVSGVQNRVILAIGASSSREISGYCLITGGITSSLKTFTAVGGVSGTGSSDKAYSIGGYIDELNPITSVSIFSNSGNLDDGTVYVYKSA
jgi:hypothetical protein